jgi:adenylate cyclase
VAGFQLALRINPNQADAWALLTDLMVFEGRAVEGIDCARKAFRLNPYPPGFYGWVLGWAQYAADRYEDAIETLRQDAAGGTGSRRLLAASLAQLGRIDEAQKEARLYLAAIPNFSIDYCASGQPFRNDADLQHFIDGYVKAGLPR